MPLCDGHDITHEVTLDIDVESRHMTSLRFLAPNFRPSDLFTLQISVFSPNPFQDPLNAGGPPQQPSAAAMLIPTLIIGLDKRVRFEGESVTNTQAQQIPQCSLKQNISSCLEPQWCDIRRDYKGRKIIVAHKGHCYGNGPNANGGGSGKGGTEDVKKGSNGSGNGGAKRGEKNEDGKAEGSAEKGPEKKNGGNDDQKVRHNLLYSVPLETNSRTRIQPNSRPRRTRSSRPSRQRSPGSRGRRSPLRWASR